MDNLTHTLTGLMLGRAVVQKLVPRAGLLMMVAANAPDCDIWSWAGGTPMYLRYHRGITHSLAFSPVMALLPLAIVWLVERKRFNWLAAWLFAWIGVLSHLYMDWTNVYGIRLALPFSGEFFRLDAVNVVDLAIWLILLLGLAAPALAKLVSSEIGAKTKGPGRGWAIAVLALLAVYEGGRTVAHSRAVKQLESRIYEGAAPLRVAAFARSANPFSWRGVVETEPGFLVYEMNLLEEFDPGAGRMFFKAPASPAIEAARRTNEFDALLGFSNWLAWRVMPEGGDGASRVELFDLRFGTPAAPGLAASALVGRDGGVRSAVLGFGAVQPK